MLLPATLLLLASLCQCQDIVTLRDDDAAKSLSKSRSSVWVDSSRGSILSSSSGSNDMTYYNQNPKKNNSTNALNVPNFLITLMLQPSEMRQQHSLPSEGQQSQGQNQGQQQGQGHTDLYNYIKPVMLMLQQQQDLMEKITEKQEKLERMNAILQQQISHHQQQVLDALEKMQMVLEVMRSNNSLAKESTAQSWSQSGRNTASPQPGSPPVNPTANNNNNNRDAQANSVATAQLQVMRGGSYNMTGQNGGNIGGGGNGGGGNSNGSSRQTI